MNEGLAPAALAHSQRFCQMGSGYPHAVALAYGGLAQAMHDDPETVAAEVADWRRNYGEQPRDWSAIGRDEGHPGVDPELLVASMFALNGYQVYRPLADDRGVDLVVDIGRGHHVMVQVKSIRNTSGYVFMPKTGFALEPWVALALVVMTQKPSLEAPIYLIPAEQWRHPTPPFASRDYGQGRKSKPEYGLSIRKQWQRELKPWKATPEHVATVLSAAVQ